MRLAPWIAIVVLSAAVRQDDWRPLPLTRLDPPPDSVVAAGVLLVPDAGAMDVTLAVENACGGKITATQQSRGAVVKIRLAGPGGKRGCDESQAAEAYGAHITHLKPKKYQVIVYTADQDGRWHPWKAAVADVP